MSEEVVCLRILHGNTPVSASCLISKDLPFINFPPHLMKVKNSPICYTEILMMSQNVVTIQRQLLFWIISETEPVCSDIKQTDQLGPSYCFVTFMKFNFFFLIFFHLCYIFV